MPARESPSKRDPKRVEDRISTLIQLLYFKNRHALDIAINQFEEHALQIFSKWQFKSNGERDVLPSSKTSNSALRRDFAENGSKLSEDDIKGLAEYLERRLKTNAGPVNPVEKYMKPSKPEGKKSHFCVQLRLANTVSDDPMPTNEVSPNEPNLPQPHWSLPPSRRSKSEPGPADYGVPPAQHPSSSGYYPDNEMAELLVNADAMDTSFAVPFQQAACARKAGEPAKVDHSVSSEETFETPPTTPPSRKHLSPSPTERKRVHPDSMQAPPSRNVSRKTSSEKSAQEVSDLLKSRDSFSKPMIDFPFRSLRTSTIQRKLTLTHHWTEFLRRQ